MSRVFNVRMPSLLMLDHRVQDSQELAYAGRQSHFPGFSRHTKAFVKSLDNWVMPGGTRRGHVENSSYPGPPTSTLSWAASRSHGSTSTPLLGCGSSRNRLFPIRQLVKVRLA